MINLEFTEEEKNSLYYERFHHPHPRVQLKMEVLWQFHIEVPFNISLSEGHYKVQLPGLPFVDGC